MLFRASPQVVDNFSEGTGEALCTVYLAGTLFLEGGNAHDRRWRIVGLLGRKHDQGASEERCLYPVKVKDRET